MAEDSKQVDLTPKNKVTTCDADTTNTASSSADVPADNSSHLMAQQPGNAEFVQGQGHPYANLQDDFFLPMRKVKLPAFMSDRPDIWFYVVESEFATLRITDDQAKYNAILKALDRHTLFQITDVISNVPEQDKYGHLKQTLIQRLSQTREKQVFTLLNKLVLADKKPSQLLREMRDLAAGGVTDDILYQMWLNCMPLHIQPMLVKPNNVELDGLAEIADKIFDTTSHSHVTATSINQQRGNDSCTSCAQLSLEMKELKQMFAELLKSSGSDNLNNNSPRRNQRNSPRSSSLTSKQSGICFYHRKFGKNANRCSTPCTWVNTVNQGN